MFRGFDALIGRDNYCGASVTREATLAVTGVRRFLLECVGRAGLAKGRGEARVDGLDAR